VHPSGQNGVPYQQGRKQKRREKILYGGDFSGRRAGGSGCLCIQRQAVDGPGGGLPGPPSLGFFFTIGYLYCVIMPEQEE
jgi:hypothetical protein